MNWVLDIVDSIFSQAKDNGELLLDPTLNIFEAVADQQPLFQDYLDYTFKHEVCLSPDGRTRHLKYKLALDEVLAPSDGTNQRAEAKTIEYIQVQCAAALDKLHDTKLAIADKLHSDGGANSVRKSVAAHAGLQAAHLMLRTLL